MRTLSLCIRIRLRMISVLILKALKEVFYNLGLLGNDLGLLQKISA